MSTHGVLTEPSVSYHLVTHDRKGREGNRKGCRAAIHACNPTRSCPQAPTNATAPATHRPDAWMGYAADGGGL